MMDTQNSAPGLSSAPSLALLGFEPLRAAFEYLGLQFMAERERPRGDGHPVVVFPGLATDRRHTAPLMSLCEKLGYQVHDWGRGFNTGPHGDIESWLDELSRDVEVLVAEPKASVSLIGWSLGGLYAREVARRISRRVRLVITIGTPFAGSSDGSHAGMLYRWLNGSQALDTGPALRRMETAPPVPTTSIYSRTDGVVAWQACLQPGNRPTTENVEVDGSHCGLAWNPAVLDIVADRLAQPENRWKRYGAAPST